MKNNNGYQKMIKALSNPSPSSPAREKAMRRLAGMNGAEISVLEDQVRRSGAPPEVMHMICRVHREQKKGEGSGLRSQLDDGHMISVLMDEHEKILGFLDQLLNCTSEIQESGSRQAAGNRIKKLVSLAEHLVGAEPHHQREEQALFPELEKRGIQGPPQVMVEEHQRMRLLKHKILDLGKGVEQKNWLVFQQELQVAVEGLVTMLRQHIAKENDILFPMALQAIQEEKVWQELRRRADEIGYCCFTPKPANSR